MSDDRNLRIQVIFGALDRLTRPVKAIGAEARKMGEAVSGARRKIKSLEQAQGEVRRLRELEHSIVDLAAASRKESARARELHDAFVSAAAPTKKMAAELTRAQKASDLAGKAHKEEAERLTLLRTKMEGAGVDTARLGQHETRLAADIATANEALFVQHHELERVTAQQKKLKAAEAGRAHVREIADKLQSGGVKAITAGAGLAAPLVLATKQAAEFEEHLSNVTKLYAISREQAQDLADRGVKFGINPTGMADIAGQLAMGGIKADQLNAMSETVAKMKIGLNFDDAKEAGEMASGWRHAFNLDAAGVNDQAELITGLSRKWGAKGGKGQEIGDIVSNVGNLAEVAGAGRKQATALAAVLSTMNIDSGVASTGIRNLMINMTRGAAATGPQRKAFKRLGLDAKEMAAGMQRDAGGAILGLLTRIHDLPKAEQSGVLTQIFGSRSIGPMGSLVERLDRVKEALDYVKDGSAKGYGRAMEEEVTGKLGTAIERMHQAKAAAGDLGLTIGNELLPMVTGLARNAQAVVERLNGWARAHPRLTRTIVLTTAALSGVLLVGGGLAVLASTLLLPLYLLNGAFAEGSLALGGLEAVSAGAGGAFKKLLGPLRELTVAKWEADAPLMIAEAPFWLIAAAIGAVIAIVVGLALVVRKYWGPISAFLSGVGQGIAEAFGPAADGLRDLFGWIGPVAKALGTLLEPIRSTAAQLDGFRDSGREVGRVIGQAMKDALGPIGLVIDALKQLHDLLPHGAAAPVVAGGAHAAQIHAGVAAGGRPAQAAPPGRGPATVHVQVAPSPTSITVHAAPGQDPHHVGQAVHQALDRRDREAAARARSAYADRGREP